MKVLIINSVCGVGSTGKICTQIADKYISKGHTCVVAYGRGNVPCKYKEIAKRIGTDWGVKFGVLHTRITDKHGFANKSATRKFLKWADEYNPDIVWLHNIHGYYINIEMLFNWIKSRPDMEVKWSFHDSWTFTGHCSYADEKRCDKWLTGCHDCQYKMDYPTSFADNSKNNYQQKKKLFCGVKNMTLYAASEWMKNNLLKSFLSGYDIQVMDNGVDREIFKPTQSNLRQLYGLENKYVVLGVSFAWGVKKGLDVFVELSKRLPEQYAIILVGINKKVKKQLPGNIIAIERTNNQEELAKLYTMADVFVNPTREDTYPTVNMESICCGTPVVTFKTGGSPESIDQNSGSVVACDDFDGLYNEIVRICTDKPYTTQMCVEAGKRFDKNLKYNI